MWKHSGPLPGTNLTKRIDRNTRLPKPQYAPKNGIDAAALRHDLQYEQIASDYHKNPTPENKKRQMKRIHDEDDIFITDVKRNRSEDPLVATAAANLIWAKKKGEQLGILPTSKFSIPGSGMKPRINLVDDDDSNDPVYRLRKLAMKQNKPLEKNQKGGFAFAPIVIPILASAASALVGKLYDTIKNKIEGKGYKIQNHKTTRQKKKFLINLTKQIV